MEEKTLTKKWYAVYTASRAEKKVKERLEQIEIECYVPLQTVKRIWSDRIKLIEVPIIMGYIFVHIVEKDIEKVQRIQGVAFMLKERGKAVAIPDKQMNTLRFMVERSKEQIEFSTENVLPGIMVKVMYGQLEGFIGELVEVRGKYKVVLSIKSLGNIMITVSRSSVERI